MSEDYLERVWAWLYYNGKRLLARCPHLHADLTNVLAELAALRRRRECDFDKWIESLPPEELQKKLAAYLKARPKATH